MNKLPFSLCLKVDMFDGWAGMSDDEKEEALSDYLSDEYGFCVNSFYWGEWCDAIPITEIDWDTTD